MQKEEQDREYLDSLTCPSFNCYFTDPVGQEMKMTQNDAAFSASQNDDTDFEFTAFQDEAFFDDAVFPTFNTVSGRRDSSAAVLRFPFTDEDLRRREHDRFLASESSSEADEFEGVPVGTYCVWTPNSPQASPAKCKKSNSTGSSSAKKWKLLDLLRRSNSEGKESFLFLTAAPDKKKVNEWQKIEFAGKLKGKGFRGEKKVAVSAHEALYVRNRELRMVDSKKTFLPYKPDLLGFCTTRFAKSK